MELALRQKAIIKAGGIVEVRDPDLPEGAEAEVIVFLTPSSKSGELPALSEMSGTLKGVWGLQEEIDRHINGLRDEWD
jgi:hypothetical protein